MKPHPQFIQMITQLFNQQQKAITLNDQSKHNAQSVTFYSISYGKFVNDRLVNKTQAFSEQNLIEIERSASKLIIGNEHSQTIYTGLTPIQYATFNGNGYLHWQAKDDRGTNYLIAKIMAQDGTLQIEIVDTGSGTQVIHNVCELPQR